MASIKEKYLVLILFTILTNFSFATSLSCTVSGVEELNKKTTFLKNEILFVDIDSRSEYLGINVDRQGKAFITLSTLQVNISNKTNGDEYNLSERYSSLPQIISFESIYINRKTGSAKFEKSSSSTSFNSRYYSTGLCEKIQSNKF